MKIKLSEISFTKNNSSIKVPNFKDDNDPSQVNLRKQQKSKKRTKNGFPEAQHAFDYQITEKQLLGTNINKVSMIPCYETHVMFSEPY